jgi:6-phosphogluconolactonase
MVEIIEYQTREALAQGLASLVASDLRSALAMDRSASLAVPGGNTPAAFLGALAGARLDWSAVTVMATDERWVPPSDPRSNEAMIRGTFIQSTQAPFLPFWRNDSDITAAAAVLNDAVRPAAPLSSCVMGMGNDMHCASLFPGVAGLVAAMDPTGADLITALPSTVIQDGAPEWRITMTARMLCGAVRLRLLIVGDDKREAVELALAELEPLKSPAGAVLRGARMAEVHWAP